MKMLFMAPMINYSGAPKIMVWLANSFAKCGNDITFLTYYTEVENRNLLTSIKKKCFHIPFSEKWIKRNCLYLPKTVIQSYRFIKEEEFDIIFSFTDNVSIINLLVVKTFLKSRFYISERMDPYTNTGKFDWIRRKAFRAADTIIFQTESARRYFGKEIRNKSVVIPNPIVIDFEEKELIKRDNRIVSVGRLAIFQKRQDLLIDAFSEISNEFSEVTIEIYGDGNDKEYIEELIQDKGLKDRIILAGVTNNVYDSIYNARLFVMTSDFEGIPNALIEAMAMGIPVISTNCSPGGARTLIQNYENGILCKRGDKKKLVEAIRYMLKHPKEAESMAENAKKVRKKYSEELIFELWKKVIL